MPSYSQYKRQMATMDADDANIETWITVKGNHIPIMKGQSKEEAVQAFLEKKGGKSSGGAKTVMKPDIEKPRSTTVVSKGSGKAKYKVGDVTKQGKIKEVIPARLSDTPYYKLENGKTYLEEELHAEKPAEKLGKKRSLSNGGFTIGLSKKEHEKIEKYNKEVAKYDDIYKGDKAAFEKINRILAGKGTKEETETLVKNIESMLGKEAGAKVREKYASILNPTPKGEKPVKVNPLEPQTKEQARLWLADTLASTEGFTEANFSKEDKAMLKKMDEKFGEGWWKTESDKDFMKRKLRESKEKASVEKKRTELGQAWRNGEMSDKEFAAKSNSITESERYNRPVHIGEAVRNVVKKLGEQRSESKKPTGGSSSGWPESPKFEKLTEKYMPKSGAADNELGEALRSINQAVYRYYNDGDMYNKGYGKETVNAAIKHLTQLSKNKATPRHIARGIDNGLYELKTYGLKDKGRYETALKILLQTFEFADEKDIDALSKMKRNND